MPVEESVLNLQTETLENRVNDVQYQWHVFYVKSKHEQKVYDLLLRDGYVAYLPLITVRKQYSDRQKNVTEPIFKSYIFVLIKKYEIYNVIQTPGIVTYVRFAGEPATIRKKHIELIKKLILNKTEFNLTNKKVKIGDKITLKSGAFKGQKGVVKQLRGKKKLLIALESINMTIEITL